ncbi:hypothetical protein RJ640_010770 [Escallonia rubra]|uniref:Bet v I/Major latex protein domain-containing protein n=1 Tax=Escallonia rubra TaxID=112253 RepID=A0AA88R5V0_9ASTE|nr:hypothetical protein RJ640_010770 [Escallonia rubra]
MPLDIGMLRLPGQPSKPGSLNREVIRMMVGPPAHDGKEKVAKEIIEAIDEEKKSVTFKVIGGDLMELYKTFILTVHVDTKGEDNLRHFGEFNVSEETISQK